MVLGNLSKLDSAPREKAFRSSALWAVDGLPLLLVNCDGGWRFMRRGCHDGLKPSPGQLELCSRISGQVFRTRSEARESLKAALWLVADSDNL